MSSIKTLKRVLSGVLAAAMCAGMIPAGVITASAADINTKTTLYVETVSQPDGQPLEGVGVKVECTSAGQYKDYGTQYSDAAGKVVLENVPVGYYRITGMYAPEGYRIEASPQMVYLEDNDGAAPVTTVSVYANNPLIITKLGDDGEYVKGAEFTVTDSRGSTVFKGTTDESGTVIVPYLEPGDYTVTETKPADGYQQDADPQNITILEDATEPMYLVFYNSEDNGLSILKTDDKTGEPLAGAQFTLTTSTGGPVDGIETITTDSSGRAFVTGLSAGNYLLTETRAPEGYILDNAAKAITLNLEDGIKPVLVTNSKQGVILVYSKTADGQPLAGTVINVYNNENVLEESAQTNESGFVTFDGLTPGNYTLTAASNDGYVLQVSTKTAEVKKSETTEVTFISDVMPSLLITCENEDGEPVGGATFTIQRQNGSIQGPYRTNTDGYVLIQNLEPGSYVISNTDVPDGYVLTSETITRELIAGQQAQANFIVRHNPSIEIFHYVRGTATPLEGGKFELWQGNQKLAEAVSGSDGRVLFDNLTPGNYTVRQTETADGYTIDTPSQDIELLSAESGYLQFSSSRMSAIMITKTDAHTGDPLAGAVFQIRDLEGNVVDTVTTGTDGVATSVVLPAGNYMLAEIQAPDGYVRTEAVRIATVRTNEICSERFTNEKMSAIVITALDYSGAVVPGAVFTVTSLDTGEVVETVTTDEAGVAVTSELEPGRYIVREVYAPLGYVMETQVAYDVVVATDNASALTFWHSVQSVIQIRNEDSDGNPIAGGQFKVVEEATGHVVGYYTTDESGIVSTPVLPEGTYIVTQVVAADGYFTKNETYTVELKDNKAEIVRFVNGEKSVLNIKKTDQDGKPLAGAVFTLSDESGHVVGRYTSDSTGCVTTQPLDPGTYLLREYFAPDGYVITDACRTNVIIKDGEPTYVEMTNKKAPVIQIMKEDAITGEPLAGAEFTVYNDGGEEVGTYVTNQDGLATTEELAPGDYTVSESKAPAGYTLDPSAKNVTVRAGEASRITVANYPTSGLFVSKVDENGNPLAGAEFTLYEANGDVITTLTTDINGIAEYQDIDAGSYFLRETKAPAGYQIDTTLRPITVKSEMAAEVKVVNNSLSSIIINKTDADTGAVLSGATFEITNASGNVIDTLRTDSAGRAQTGKLENGTYYVKETVAPTGYVVDTAVRTVELNGSSVTLNITNSMKSAVHIHLNDAVTNDGLTNGSFVIRTEAGVVVGQGKTENGLLIIPNLPDGDYVVSQISAPDGYIKDTITQSITVVSNQVTHVYFLNQPMTGLVIENVTEDQHRPLAGGVFEVYDETGKQVYHGTTDETGTLYTGILTPGKYTIKQMATAEGYTIVTSTQTITVSVDIPTTAVFENRPHSSLQIKLVDEETRDNLEGAMFKVQSVSGSFETEVRTDEGGLAIVDNLEPGYYIVTQVTAPDGYVLKGTYQFAYMKTGYNTQLTFTNQRYVGLVIENVILDTHEPLSGGVFEVWRLNTQQNPENKVFEGTTDNTGVLQTGVLDPGKYLIKHLATADGYTIMTATQIIEVKVNEESHAVFYNKPTGTLEITKVDSESRDPLEGATFKVVGQNSSFVQSVTTDETGIARITDLDPGLYVVTETNAPEGYTLNNIAQNVTIRSGETSRLTFANDKMAGIIIEKTDANTGDPLQGAHFEIAHENGKIIEGNWVTDEAGRIETGPLEPGRYTIKELVAPDGYILDDAVKTVTVTNTTPTIVPFTNRAQAGITIQKVDAADQRPLAGAVFEVWDRNGSTLLGTYTTDLTGFVSTDIMDPGTYQIRETKAPTGYNIDVPSKTVTLRADEPLTVKFADTAMSSLQIVKVDATDNTKYLSGATFTVYNSRGQYIGDYTTDESGTVFVPDLTAGTYRITETRAPSGYIIDNAAHTVVVRENVQTKLTVTNTPVTGIVINKVDAETGDPLEGARFEISELNGNIVNTYVTDSTGVINTEALDPGSYVIKELQAPDGYMIDDSSHIVEVKAGEATVIRLTNSKMSGIEIKKIDATDNQPLAGAVFELRDSLGNKIDELTTDSTGYAYSGALEDGEYILAEIQAPEGYQIDTTEKTVVVQSGQLTKVTFTNSPLAALRIQKIDGKTGDALSGAVFKVTKANGDYVGEFVTERDGLVTLPTLEPGMYVITELSAPEGYIVDNTPRTVEVKTGVPTVLTIENNRVAGLQIRKTVTQTGEPLEGVTFKIKDAEGSLVGNYTTDSMGLIYVSLEPGEYIVQETYAPDGYVIDTEPKFVTVGENEATILEITNDKMSNVRIHKIDAETGDGIYGVTFEIKDSRNNYIGTYKTDDQGYIDLSAVLPEGKYVITETQAADGYVLDEIPRTVTVSPDEPTEIVWENSREKGQVTVLKYSADDNAALNIPANSPLEGAEFTISTLNGEVVDVIRTNANGEAYSGALDLGRYLIQETKAPNGYSINSKAVEINVTSKNQDIEVKFFDTSMDIAVNIEKGGEKEVQPGSNMKYYLMNIRNDSNVALDNFFFSDKLPTDAVRAQTLYTGTYSASVYYSIEYKTNMYDYRILQDNLNSKTQYSFDLSSTALNLQSGEYVTDIRFVFGTVPAGFHEQVSPVLYVYVLPDVDDNYQIINRCEVGGQYDGNWVTDADQWTTLVERPSAPMPPELPQTGF